MRKIYIQEEVCIGCHLCEVYCQQQHSRSKELVKAFKRESPRPLPRLWLEERKPVSFPVRCQHCDEPQCVYACLTGALSQNTDNGLVTLDEERCIGCWTCMLVCPFSAIRQDTNQRKVVKCDLCPGEDIPVCVSNCPNEALVYDKTENEGEGKSDCHN